MDSKIYKAILKTICYADIFDHPLKEEEVYRWVKDIKIARYYDIKRANGVIEHKNKFMFIRGREELIAKRLQRENISQRKLAIAEDISAILKHIPTIKLIGVSGSLAMSNATERDDIDLFIITQSKTVWLTRLLTTLIVEIFSKRRRPNDKDFADKICLNMFVDEDYLTIPKEKQNIYTAHEVCQLKVIYDRDDTYSKFLVANAWVKKFLPNAVSSITYQVLRMGKRKKALYIIHNTLYILEWLAKRFQLWYMRHHRTREVITDHYLAFHPKDYTNDILSDFQERMKRYASQV